MSKWYRSVLSRDIVITSTGVKALEGTLQNLHNSAQEVGLIKNEEKTTCT
jgi:hypothetical protein